jgi:hypothetical protein
MARAVKRIEKILIATHLAFTAEHGNTQLA